jgi:hypothetical protein
MAFNYSPKVITDGLVLYLDAANQYSYVSGSTSWNDISRGGNNGTLVNGPTYSSANGGSIVFDGVDDYVTTTFSTNPQYFTFECIFKLNNINSTQVLVGKFSGTGNDYWMGSHTGNIVFSTNGSVLNSGVPNTTLSYYIVTCVIGPSLKEIYVNGVLKNSIATVSLNPGGTIAIATFGNVLGYYASSNIPSFKFYNRALSAQEILQNFNATKTRFGL